MCGKNSKRYIEVRLPFANSFIGLGAFTSINLNAIVIFPKIKDITNV